MAIKTAQLWMQNHSHIVPALAVNHDAILELFEDEHQAHNLADLTTRDPGLYLGLLKKVNARRSPSSGLEAVDSPQAAFSLLGDHATQVLFKSFPVAEKQLKDAEQLSAFLQIISRSFHNKEQTEKWARLTGYNQISPLTLAGLLAYSGELLCCCYDFDRYRKFLASDLSEQDEEQIFGFRFEELTLALAEKFNFPSLMIRSIPIKQDTGQRSQLVKYLSIICRYCEQDWYSEKIRLIEQQFAEYLQQPLDKVVHEIHQFSVQAARNRVLKDSWHAAAKLILLPEIKKPKPSVEAADQIAATQPPSSGYEEVLRKIRELLKNPKATQSQILNTCIHGLHDDIGLTKVNLLLLSKDQSLLQSRMNVGLNPESPLRHFKIEVSKAGLLKMLLNKPQAIWINNSSFSKYQKIIPQSFQASIRTNNFFAMSLFINERPIGIIFADQSESSNSLNQEIFNQFKHTIVTTSKALTFILKRSASK